MMMDDRTIEEYRREFPVAGQHIYLDHAGVAPLSLRVKRAIESFLRGASEHGAFLYPEWAKEIARARDLCARLIGADPSEVAFVKSTSHGLSIAAGGLEWKDGDNVVFCEKDFPSNIYPWLSLGKRGVEARPVPYRKGTIMVEDIEERMDGRTRLVAVSTVQFTSGFRIDLERIGDLCRKRGALLCVDAIQSLGVIPMDVKGQKVDLLSADAHKWLLGPEGIGIFYCRRGIAGMIGPVLVGWKSVRNELDFEHPRLELKGDALRFEEGSQNVMGIIGLGAAVGLLLELGMENIMQRVMFLGDCIIRHLDKRGFELLTPRAHKERGGGITFRGGFDPPSLRDRLREKGIMVNVRGGGLRVSPHFYNTEQEIGQLFQEIDRMIG